MKIIGLTGSIGTGKSMAASMLRRMGYPVFDADAIVHALTSTKGAGLPLIQQQFPGFVVQGRLQRKELAHLVFADQQARLQLESILHPMVKSARERFLARHRTRRSDLVFLDIPLLYEKGMDRGCDKVLLMSAPPFLQRDRLLARPGMSDALFQRIKSSQMPDWEKRKRADIIIHSGLGKRVTWRQLRQAIRAMKNDA